MSLMPYSVSYSGDDHEDAAVDAILVDSGNEELDVLNAIVIEECDDDLQVLERGISFTSCVVKAIKRRANVRARGL
jgi:hypothetical protein